MLPRLPGLVALALGYVALTGNLEPLNLLAAVLVSTIVSLLLPPVETGQTGWRRWPPRLWALLVYLPLVAWDVLLSGLSVARVVLQPSLPIRPGVVDTPTPPGPEWMRAANAHAISLTPGEVVMDMDDDRMRVHCLDAVASRRSLPGAQRWRRRWLSRIADQHDRGELP